MEHTGILSLILPDELAETVHDHIVITVNGEKCQIPLEITPPRPSLVIPDLVDFGLLVQENKVIHRTVWLKNEGLKPGTFRIGASLNTLLEIVPHTGTINEKSSLELTVGFIPKTTQKLNELLSVELEGRETAQLRIVGEVIQPGFALVPYTHSLNKIGPGTAHKSMRRICFKAMYYNTDRFCRWYLCNQSPKETDFVSVLCDQTNPSVTRKKLADVPTTAEACFDSLIDMVPCHGQLEPYGRIPVQFRLRPRWPRPQYGFQSSPEQPPQKSFSVYLRITKVGLVSARQSELTGQYIGR
ncbi:unnamed protein product [Echinostoma caproni]|uniref:Hydrocephalus-inducing protein homolog n=1 Tax=Echinostoma caproni TaxID=27848 RepID=A0A183BEN9_9TREM|nr:unnamed protein product [Echinostoma caproni]